MFMRPEVYEEEMERRRERKAEQKEKTEVDRKAKSDSRKDHVGAFGKGGRLTNSHTYAQYIMKNTIKNTIRDEDPREVLLGRAKEAEENPLFVATAYKETQPKTLFTHKKETVLIKRRDV